MIEGELFGYVRGAFSGAVADYDGPPAAASHAPCSSTEWMTRRDAADQALRSSRITRQPLGESTWREVDFRVVRATNRDLRSSSAAESFGSDLYQRLAILRIELPPPATAATIFRSSSSTCSSGFYRESRWPDIA